MAVRWENIFRMYIKCQRFPLIMVILYKNYRGGRLLSVGTLSFNNK